MKRFLKRLLRPVRRLAGRFVLPMDSDLMKNLMPIHLVATFVCAENIPGDYLEFGVFRGHSFVTAYQAISGAIEDWGSRRRAYMAYSNGQRAEAAFRRVVRNEIRFFAFDSFEGLPEPSGIDLKAARFLKGRYDCSQEEFTRILRRNGVDCNRVVIIPGFYENSLTDEVKKRYDLRAASIVMIDCDLYASTEHVLKFVTNLIVDGTVMIFDDWFSFRGNPNLGEQRACAEWLRENPGIQLTPFARWGVAQQAFVVHRSETSLVDEGD